jgi:hypothetical protein
MKTQYHVVSSVPIGAAIYLTYHDVLSTVLAMGASVLIDVDHLIDYIITQKRIDPLEKVMKAFESFNIVRKNYFFFHSWEIAIALLVLSFVWPHEFIVATLFGYSIHMTIDQVYNTHLLGKFNSKNAFYFFLFRLKHNFDVLPLRKYPEAFDSSENIYNRSTNDGR